MLSFKSGFKMIRVQNGHFGSKILKFISQGKNFFGKLDISPSCGFFQYFLAPFDTFTTRYDHSHIKFEFSGYFYLYQHFI